MAKGGEWMRQRREGKAGRMEEGGIHKHPVRSSSAPPVMTAGVAPRGSAGDVSAGVFNKGQKPEVVLKICHLSTPV